MRKKTPLRAKQLMARRSTKNLNDWAKQFCLLFNDPIEFLNNVVETSRHQSEDALTGFVRVIQDIKEKLRKLVTAAEEYFEIRAKFDDARWRRKVQSWHDKALKADRSERQWLDKELVESDEVYRTFYKLQEAMKPVNDIPTITDEHSSIWWNLGGEIVTLNSFKIDDKARQAFAPAALEVAITIENFKSFLVDYQHRFPISVCQLETCQKFFLKDRKTQRYCSESHRKLDWKRKNL
jgi:hypothetical protein